MFLPHPLSSIYYGGVKFIRVLATIRKDLSFSLVISISKRGFRIRELTAFIDDDSLKKIANIVGGEDAVRVVMALKDMGETTDDQILMKTTIKLNDVRKILFKLYDHSIVQCDRKRDEKTGWIIFHWKLQVDQIEGFIRNYKKRIRKILETRLEYEKDHAFYYCYNPTCNRVTFEDALELVFRCPKCSNSFQYFENSKIVDVLEERVNKLDKEFREE